MQTPEMLAVGAYRSILTILALKQGTSVGMVETTIFHTPKPHVEAVQFILKGSGCATALFEPDGEWGEQSLLSLRRLYTVVTTSVY